MIDTIYIARHGFRANWMTSAWTTPTGLDRDYPLAAFGEVQAVELASYLESLPKGKRPSAIFSSPYYRCLQTGKPIAERLSLPIYIEHGLSEWYFPVAPGTGLLPRPKIAADLRAMLHEINPSWTEVEIDLSWNSIWLPPRKGEDVQEIHTRMADVLVRLVREVGARPDMQQHRNVLILSHAAPIVAMCRHLAAQPELPLRVGCCTLSQFSRKRAEGGKGGWEAVSLASSAHLTDQASLRDWGFEDVATDHATGKLVHEVGVLGTEGEEDDTHGPQIYSNKL